MENLRDVIEQSDDVYRSLYHSIPNPVFILDRKNLKVLDCNTSVEGVYGYTNEELIGCSFLILFDDTEHQNYALELRNSKVLYHVKQITKVGRNVFVNIQVSPYEWAGRPALLVTCNDVIRVLTIRQQLVHASKMATLGEMATGIAHELNQPLSVIKTASSFLLNRLNKGEEIRGEILRAMVEEIDNHVERASGIISHIKGFGRKSKVKKEDVQVNDALCEVISIFSEQLRLRQIRVVPDLEEQLPPVVADHNRLQQVFINLLINARDAIEEKREKLGGQSEEDKIFLTTHTKCGFVLIEVRDTGVGIPGSLLDKIFEPFFTTKKEGRGTGLGLSISYGIVHEYGGTIRVKTKEDEGSVFIIQLPVQVQAHGS